MNELFPVFVVSIALLVLSVMEILLLRVLNRRWWSRKWIRVSSFILPGFGVFCIAIWTSGIFSGDKIVMIFGAVLAALTIIMIISLTLSLPISGVLNMIHDRFEKRMTVIRSTPDDGTISSKRIPRRAFLKTAAAIVPITSLTMGGSGVAQAFNEANVYTVPIYFKNLPRSLHGFKILHVSDIHVGYFVDLKYVENFLLKAKTFAPDIILATGDLSDKADVYGDILKLLTQVDAPHGVYASLGNHEYFRGISHILRAYSNSEVTLLKDSGTILEIGGVPVYLGGADDPKFINKGDRRFFVHTVDSAFGSVPKDAFTILLSHRPHAFNYASEKGVDLTLSGHMHGGQVGLCGRSLFESIWPESYFWGIYRRNASCLYTTAGAGHWFPFRIGCPQEVPVIELRQASRSYS